ncbi:MAG TPA: EAL domain-containing protein [Xanthobacteraceae bacterium]
MSTRLHLLKLPKLIAERRSSAIFGTVLIAVLWLGLFLKYAGDVKEDKGEAERTIRNFAMVFEENVLRSIGEIDKALLYLRRSVETRKDSTDFTTIVNTTDVLSEIIIQVAVIDADGMLRGSNVGPQPAPVLDLSDREHYKVHVGRSEDLLFISKPVVGRVSKRWSVQFSRRFLNKDRSFGGVVVASLDPAHLTNFYDRVDLGLAASIALIGSDGVVRSSGGSAAGFALGQDLEGTELRARIAGGSNLTFGEVDRATGERRLIAIRKVRDHPLWVGVSTNSSQIYRSSWSDFQLNAAVVAVLTLLVLAAMERILRTEARARLKAEQLQLTLEHMSQGIMLVTSDLQIPIMNRRCGELLGLPASTVESPPSFDQLVELQKGAGALDAAAASIGTAPAEHGTTGSGPGQFSISERKMADGSVIEIRSGRLPDGSLVQTFSDITKRWEAEARVTRLASEDPLTGLPNRRVFSSRLDEMSVQCRSSVDRARKGAPFAVLFLDLDRFKVVNDTLGHRIGDLLLQEVAGRLRRVLPGNAVLARIGGDEFAVVVSSFQSRTALESLADICTHVVSQPYEIDGHRILTSVSIGIAVGPEHGANTDDLLMAADLALYAVKAGTKGTFRFYERCMNEEVNDRRQIEMDLREAIERNQLELHYQPIIDLRRDVVTGFEALARWRHPSRGMVPPAVFIPVAEDSGLILPIGTWALREACRRAAQWPEHLKVAVNLSPVQFSIPNLYDTVKSILAETGLAPRRLELEITERLFMEDSDRTLSILHRLKQLGVRISMDDFGTGFSSLSYLRSFPFDKIKVDRAFVSDLAAGTEHVVIVQAVVSIARALGMTTTAEGVETAGQREFLAALGSDEAQGYLFSAPVPLDRVPEVIARWAAEGTLAA